MLKVANMSEPLSRVSLGQHPIEGSPLFFFGRAGGGAAGRLLRRQRRVEEGGGRLSSAPDAVAPSPGEDRGRAEVGDVTLEGEPNLDSKTLTHSVRNALGQVL